MAKPWIHTVKLRALAYVGAIALAAAATITLVGVPWVPVVGMAAVAACVSLSKLTTRMLKPTCLSCGHDLSGEPIGVQGIACPGCGSVNSPTWGDLAFLDRFRSASDEADTKPTNSASPTDTPKA